MLRSSDIIRLPFPPDLTQAGIGIATRRLAYSCLTPGGMQFDRLQSAIAEACVELALRRYLQYQGIPFTTEDLHPFSQPDRIMIVLGGRRIFLHSNMVGEEEWVKRLPVDPEWLDSVSVRLPAMHQPAEAISGNDLAVIAFVVAGVHTGRSELRQAAREEAPFLCSHTMPEAWRRIRVRKPQGRLIFKMGGEASNSLDVYGLDLQQALCVERITINPEVMTETRAEFISVSCLQTSNIPGTRIEIHSPAHRHPYTILPLGWKNVWVYGQGIILAGYLPYEQIWSSSRGSSQRAVRSRDTLEVRVAELYPLPPFLEQLLH
jgi:hypothetical protein